MMFRVCILVYLVVFVDSRNVRKVSEKTVSKRAANGDYVPDWIQFNNKQGEVLGELNHAEPKKKPKKRLALPVNFVLRAVAEPEGDDYYDKGQGEADGDEYSEKKEWSDENRPANSDKSKQINHTDISDINGVVNIITQKQPNFHDLLTQTVPTVEGEEDEAEKKQEKQNVSLPKKEVKTKDTKVKVLKQELKKKEKKVDKSTDDDNNSESEDTDVTEKPKLEPVRDDRNASAARKALVLHAVDELKARHEEEQKVITEKLKEEEILEEEHERDKIRSSKQVDKYGRRKPKITTDYEEYEDKLIPLPDKYKINYKKTTTSTLKPKTTKRRVNNVENSKLSVFRNPRLYMEENELTTVKPTLKPRRTGSSRFSSRFSQVSRTTTVPPKENKDESVRISLVPKDDEFEGEPSLFFPKKKKNKRKRKNKVTTASPDSFVAETVEGKTAKTFATPSGFTVSTISDSTFDSFASSTQDADSTNSHADVVPASTDNKEEKKAENFDYKKGRGREYSTHHDEQHDEVGKKAYEGVHDEEKNAQGKHDREDHSGEYKDRSGVEKEHSEGSAHYGSHHHEEHGKKHAKYEESGKHSKGHSTKGSHDIHKKEEYEKRVEFFEEDGDSSEEEKHGGHNHEHSHAEGGHFKKGKHDSAHHEHHKGEAGDHVGGGHAAGHKGHKAAGGHDSHGNHHDAHHQKGGRNKGHKWVFYHGSPSKGANLIVADQRPDKYFHGPQYFG